MNNPRPTSRSSNKDESFADWYAYDGVQQPDDVDELEQRSHTVSQTSPPSPPPAVPAPNSVSVPRNDNLAYEMSHVPAQHTTLATEIPSTPALSQQSHGRIGSFESERALSGGSHPISRTRSEATATSEAPLSRGVGQEKIYAYPSASSTPVLNTPDGFNYKRPPFSRNSSAGWTQIAPEGENAAQQRPHLGHSRLASESRPNLEFAEGDFVSCLVFISEFHDLPSGP
jgi:hypothetical protein